MASTGMVGQKRKIFNPGPAPADYVPGAGRGAVMGFQTGPEVGGLGQRPPTLGGMSGPSSGPPSAGRGVPPQALVGRGAGRGDGAGPLFGTPPPGYKAGIGRGTGGFENGISRDVSTQQHRGKKQDEEEENDEEDINDSNYNEFSGYGGNLFTNAEYDEDDMEADNIYDSIDDRMDSKRRDRRELRLKQELNKFRTEKPKLQQQFADLKKQLVNMTDDDWNQLPEIGDYTIKKRKMDKFTPVPDSLLEKARLESQNYNTLDSQQQQSGFQTPAPGSATPMVDLTQVGEARGQVLSVKLDQISDSVSGQTVVDPKGYLTDLNSLKINSDADIGDIKKARVLMKSVRVTNPSHGPGWIASARLEEVAGRIVAARNLIAQGCEAAGQSEDVWLEAARLQTPENAKAILAKAVKKLPTSFKIWLQAAQLETDEGKRKKVLRKALEVIPNSVKLWRAAIELEDPQNAKIMLSRAVECVPNSVDMWLALARLETYQNARKVLNAARETIPTEPLIWITAAKLEEANGNTSVDKIIKKAIKSLQIHHVPINREYWLKQAEECENDRSIATCQAIVQSTVGVGVEEEDRKKQWIEDAESATQRNCIETARAIYAFALTHFQTKKSLWLMAAQLEKAHGTRESLDTLLRKAVTYCPQAEMLWLMAAKEKWVTGEVGQSREILTEAFAANPNSEQIWLAAVKLEFENNEEVRARGLLERARERAGTERVWLKSITLEREIGNTTEEERLLNLALEKYPAYSKFWMMGGQMLERQNNYQGACEKYMRGTSFNPTCIPLWTLAANCLQQAGQLPKARTLLERARGRNPKSDELWLASVRLEAKAGDQKAAEQQLAKALQTCPASGILWAEAVNMAPRPKKKSRSVDAIKKCDNDPHVTIAVSKLFWLDRKIDKARRWFDRAVLIQPDLGDSWATFLKFEMVNGTEEQVQKVISRCVEADPHHGQLWCSVSKAVGNARWTCEQVLKEVAKLIKPVE